MKQDFYPETGNSISELDYDNPKSPDYVGPEVGDEKLTRYTVELDAYLWAKNDEEANIIAEEIAAFLRTREDNEASVLKLHLTPFGSMHVREVEVTP